jgi:hypothetical protein
VGRPLQRHVRFSPVQALSDPSLHIHSDVQLHPVHCSATLAMRPYATRPFPRAVYCRSAVVAATARFQRSCSALGFFQTLNVHNGGHSTVIRWWRLQPLLMQQPPEVQRWAGVPIYPPAEFVWRVRRGRQRRTLASRHSGIACHKKRRERKAVLLFFPLFWVNLAGILI